MLNGIVNDDFVPVVPVSIKREDKEWQELNLLLDTGFDGEITLDSSLLTQYDLATQPDHRRLTPEQVMKTKDVWGTRASYTGELLCAGQTRTAEIRLLAGLPINGMLGNKLLKYRPLTVNAELDGTVTIESRGARSHGGRTWWRRHRKARQKPSRQDLMQFLWKELPHLYESYLPWTNLQVQDSNGKFNSIWVNVDTGSNQELSLPTKWVSRLGLKPSDRDWLHTADGLIEVGQGKATVIWQGKERPVRCTYRPDDKPPLIGMNLLKGNRITINFDLDRPTVEIERIPQRSLPLQKLLDSLRYRLRF